MHGCLLREAHLEMHHTCKQVRNLVVQFSTPDIIHRYTVSWNSKGHRTTVTNGSTTYVLMPHFPAPAPPAPAPPPPNRKSSEDPPPGAACTFVVGRSWAENFQKITLERTLPFVMRYKMEEIVFFFFGLVAFEYQQKMHVYSPVQQIKDTECQKF